jgi:hypothetical protein
MNAKAERKERSHKTILESAARRRDRCDRRYPSSFARDRGVAAICPHTAGKSYVRDNSASAA